eukprot:2029470-Alexandrium_andersonii.AAC.1
MRRGSAATLLACTIDVASFSTSLGTACWLRAGKKTPRAFAGVPTVTGRPSRIFTLQVHSFASLDRRQVHASRRRQVCRMTLISWGSPKAVLSSASTLRAACGAIAMMRSTGGRRTTSMAPMAM